MADDREFQSGERVVLGKRGRSSMTNIEWSGNEPPNLHELDWAEELGAEWEGDELVIYDYPGFTELLGMYERDEYMPDND